MDARQRRAGAGDRCELHDGDRIQLGNVLLRFQMRAAQASGQRKPAGKMQKPATPAARR